ncbi:hypothetical protein [Pseudomonas sp. 25 E 4]|nr:hypothetical protein [Pseudomonas sp. 25 E 4]
MAVTQLVTGQGRGQQHEGVGAWVELIEEANEGLVQRTQPAALDPTVEQLQQVGGAAQGCQFLQR